MAVTRINTIHQQKGKNNFQTLEKCINYINDDNKINDKDSLVKAFDCGLDTATIDFMIPKKIYEELVGRTNKNNILAYHLIQSFKPEEISPELANKIGYELAEEVTKGEYQFIVATHTDKAHIHNHIIFNSTSSDGTKKYDEAYSWRKISRISDRLCLENNLSIVDNKLEDGKFYYKSNAYNKHMGDKIEPSFSEILKNNIKKSLLEYPEDFEDFLNKMREKGYEIKINKNIAFKGNGQKRFRRLSTLGEQYSEEIIREAINLNNETKLLKELEERNKNLKVKEKNITNNKEVQKQEVEKVSIVERLNKNKTPQANINNKEALEEVEKVSIMERLNKATEPPVNNFNEEEVEKVSIIERLNKNKTLEPQNNNNIEVKKVSIMEKLNKNKTQSEQNIKQNKINTFIEIKELAESKGAGYEAWASKYNLNELVKTFNYLSQNNLLNYEKLEEKIKETSKEFNKADSNIKEISSEMKKISTLQNHIINFSKTKEIYLEYRGTGYNQKFKKKNEEKIKIHQEAKAYFKELGYSKLPKMDELKKEYAILSVEKKKLYKVYNDVKAEKEKYTNIKSNIDNIYTDKNKSQKKSIKEHLRE